MGERKTTTNTDNVAFRWEENIYSIQINEGAILLKCTNNVKASESKSLSTSFDKSIQLLQVISTSYSTNVSRVDSNGQPMSSNWSSFFSLFSRMEECFSLIINYWIKSKRHQRKLQSITLLTLNEKACEEWQKLIELEVKTELKKHGYVRPKNLLIFVNPYAGKKRAESVYKSIAAPLFKLAGVKETVVVTEYAGHAKEYIASTDISDYDGIVAVGGDGTYSEISNGVLLNEQKRRNISLESSNALEQPVVFVKPGIRLGLIAAGSGHMISRVSQGTSDPETSVLQIISGESHPVDISSVYDDHGKFVQFCSVMCSYGFVAKVATLGESMRRFGPVRYDIAIVRLLIQHQSYPCQISYLLSSPDNPADVKKDSSRCRYPCPVCLDKPDQSQFKSPKSDKQCQSSPTSSDSIGCDPELSSLEHSSGTRDEMTEEPKDVNVKDTKRWKVMQGSFHMVNLHPNAGMYDKSSQGFSPSAHIADGTADLLLVHSTTRSSLTNLMLSLRTTADFPRFPFVEVHRVKGFRIQPLLKSDLTSTSCQEDSFNETKSNPSESPLKKHDDNSQVLVDISEGVWFVDGEYMNSTSFTVWMHRGLVNIFAKGIEDD